jgi:hypothetical protein
MSATPDQPSRECQHPECSTVGPKWEFHHGKYCSNKCEVRDEGRDALARFRYDHCLCFTCFRDLKTLNPPKPDFEFTENGHGWTFDEDGEPTLQYYSQEVTRQAATGRQFLTPSAGKGEKQREDDVITGTICEACGQTSHTIHDPLISSREAIGRLVSLLQDADDLVVDVEVLHRIYADTDDLEFAVGRALQD